MGRTRQPWRNAGDLLRKEGMFIRFGMRVLKTYINYRRGKPTPSNLSLRLVYRCNLRCSFCRFWKHEEIEETGLERINLLIDDMTRLGVPYFNITGGEPLLRPDLEEIAAYAASKGIYTALNTNGTMITEKRAADLVRYFNAIKISLDGFEKTHDLMRGVPESFRKANAGINHLMKARKKKAKVIVHLVANEKNVDEIPEFVKMYSGLVDRVSVMPFFDMVSQDIYDSSRFVETWKAADEAYTLNESESMIKQPELTEGRRYCDAAALYYSVLPDGKIICCPHYPLVLGNIKEQTFHEVWSRDLTASEKAQIENCKGCYAKCTTEVSKLMRKTPFQLLMTAPSMIRKHL
jgi:MoaA/NifB/PqqE/SkfB family radical SAM enzyme